MNTTECPGGHDRVFKPTRSPVPSTRSRVPTNTTGSPSHHNRSVGASQRLDQMTRSVIAPGARKEVGQNHAVNDDVDDRDGVQLALATRAARRQSAMSSDWRHSRGAARECSPRREPWVYEGRLVTAAERRKSARDG